MSLARFKDLCIDATSAADLGTFWGRVLGLELQVLADGDVQLSGPTPQHTLWVNRVPDPKQVKHRIHLDVRARSVADLEGLGAVVVDADSFPWAIMTDPEGGEFCVFLRDDLEDYRLYEVGIDCRDHAASSSWWTELLGGRRVLDEQGFSYVEEIPGVPFDCLVFAPVPEPKTVKNRLHLDVVTGDLSALIEHGASLLRAQDDEIGWNVMADPEGNEFCVFTNRFAMAVDKRT